MSEQTELYVYTAHSLEKLKEMLPGKNLVEIASVEAFGDEPAGHAGSSKAIAIQEARENLARKVITMGCNACVILEEGASDRRVKAPTLYHPDNMDIIRIYEIKGIAYKVEDA